MNLSDRLRSHPFAAGLSDPDLEVLAPCARWMRFGEGSLLFREGGAAESLYLLHDGRVALEQHVPGQGVIQLESLQGGDTLGLSWLFPGGRWMLDARAVEATQALVLEATALNAAMERDSALGLTLAKHMLHQLYHRLERVRLQRLDVYRGGR